MQEVVYVIKFDNGQFAWTELSYDGIYNEVWTVKDIARATLYSEESADKVLQDMISGESTSQEYWIRVKAKPEKIVKVTMTIEE